jgi:hypothetical protein
VITHNSACDAEVIGTHDIGPMGDLVEVVIGQWIRDGEWRQNENCSCYAQLQQLALAKLGLWPHECRCSPQTLP